MAERVTDERLDRVVRWFTIDLLDYEQIGARLGVTRERVRQLLAMRGLSGKDGGIHIRYLQTKAEREKVRALFFLKRHGITKSEYQAVREHDGGRVFVRFKNFRRVMKKRYPDQPFLLRFGDWWKIWKASGVYKKYGRRAGHYIMTRKNRAAGFTVANMKIMPSSDHASITIRRTRQKWGNDLRLCRKKRGRKR